MNTVIDYQRLLPAWQTLQSVAPIAHIESETGYEQAIILLNSLLDIVRDDAKHPLYSLVAVVGDLIEAYEIDHDSFCIGIGSLIPSHNCSLTANSWIPH